jgi:surface carbohydrate biosynthesis protein
MTARLPLIIPVENQVRELDPKLLLACIAARRGLSSIIGSHREIDFRIAAFPRSLYLCKSLTVMNLKMFRIMHRLGHEIVSWDEEALVHLPAAMYFSRRLSPLSLNYVSHLFAWGDDNAALWRQYPAMRKTMPIHVTGNPRGDLLRPEIREFYRADAEDIRRQHGKFILVNTNFNHVNAWYPAQNLFRPMKKRGRGPAFGKAGKGMSVEFARALRDHKQALFDQFRAMIPELEQAFPDCSIIVRPHPTENPAAYREIASRCQRVRVINAGNVVAWLLATRALVHNGCTTGAEAYAMGVPAISYRPRVDEDIDQGFYRLPNQLSHQCFSYPELRETLGRILGGELGAADGKERQALIDRHVAARDGALACERMVDVLETIARERSGLSKPAACRRLAGQCLANGRHLGKWLKSGLPGSHAPPEFHRHRYPGISLADLRGRLSRLQRVLGDGVELKVEPVREQIFRIGT